MSFEIIDADGHVTETWEQIARHLDEPYRKRPLLTPLFPQDGWDRRLIGTKRILKQISCLLSQWPFR